MWVVEESEVEVRTEELRTAEVCVSNDPHIIALAQVSRSRRLYSNDSDLQADFTDKMLIDKPRGKVYSTMKNRDFSGTHRALLKLKKNELCRVER